MGAVVTLFMFGFSVGQFKGVEDLILPGNKRLRLGDFPRSLP